MIRILLALLLLTPALADGKCPSEPECDALLRWRSAAHVAVHLSRNDLTDDQAVDYAMEVRGREVLYSYRQGASSVRLLSVPPLATLYGGLPAPTTCRETGDTEPYLAGQISLPLGYLAKAFPDGPGTIVKAMAKDITVKPGRMYVDPGNHIEVKRVLDLSLTVAPDQTGEGITFSIVERAESSDPKEPKFHYHGLWSKKVANSAVPDQESLSLWLVCPWSGSSIDGSSTLGDLRAKANSIER